MVIKFNITYFGIFVFVTNVTNFRQKRCCSYDVHRCARQVTKVARPKVIIKAER